MKHLVSFGFKNGAPKVDGALVLDVRKYLKKNPYHNKALRPLRGTDREVQIDIEQTPGFEESYKQLKFLVESYPGPVFLGCTGGHHRSVYMAVRLGAELGLDVTHRDKDAR